MLFDAVMRHHPDRTATAFSFRGQRPLFDFDSITVNGRAETDGGTTLSTAMPDGDVAMEAAMRFVWPRPRSDPSAPTFAVLASRIC